MFEPNDKINKLTIISQPYKNGKRLFVTAQCDCGKIKEYRVTHLTSNITKSCGCYSHNLAKKRHTTHGMYGTRIYKIWSNIKNRCTNPNYFQYKNYGGRGINICKEWELFENFFNDMKDSYSDNLTIDRTDNNKGYSKNNCRWVTMKVQQRNRRNNTIWTFAGETKTAADWAESIGINYGTLLSRINNSKWSLEKALTTPLCK